ncbi:histidine phosphatase family protein [Novosphingobium sp. FKTRR1]|uniref:histidine phosphatase family protein n=1 Tax=unclassified Novosphingobium TaxID=2644732 RepID=UPI001CF04B58|nr:histidine phosphatase family protein [Novosphingobium sp. FKTRR1]
MNALSLPPDGGALPTLYLVRHGETAWTLTGQHTGSTDIALTAQGEAMASDLAPLLAGAPFIRILVSPRQRARLTCELATGRADATIEPDLAEWDYGDYEGLHTSAILRDRPGWDLFRDGCPGGETLTDVVGRADRLLARLAHETGALALFTHGQFGCVLAARWIGLAGEEAAHFALDPAALGILGARPGHPAVAAIIRWNVVANPRLGWRAAD